MVYTMDARYFGQKISEPEKAKRTAVKVIYHTTDAAPRPTPNPKYSLPAKDMEMLRRISSGSKVSDAAARTAPPAPKPAPAKPTIDPFFRKQAERNARIAAQIKDAAEKLWRRA